MIYAPDWSAANIDWKNDEDAVKRHLDGVVEDEGPATDGRRRFTFLCPVHEADGHDHDPSGVGYIDDNPGPGKQKVVIFCGSQKCAYKEMTAVLEQRARDATAQESEGPAEPSAPPHPNTIWVDPSTGTRYESPEAMEQARRARDNGNSRNGANDDASGAQQENAAPGGDGWDQASAPDLDYLSAFEAYCYCPGFLHDNPDLPVVADQERKGVAFLFPGTRGADGGATRKVRPAMFTGGTLVWASGNKKLLLWDNAPKPRPTWWPKPGRTMGTRVAFCEGETSTIALRRAGFEAYGLTAGGATLPEEGIDGLEEAYARGVREALLFYDRDKTGLGFKTGMIARCIAAGIEPIPVDIRPLIDVYGGGNKDARDLLGLYAGNAEALRAALEEVIARAEAELDALFPEHTSAVRDVTVEWIVEGLLARNQITFLSSAPGQGKTTIIHAYCVAARDGGDFFGRRVEPHNVLLVTEEGRPSLAAKAVLYGDFPNVRVHSIADSPFPSDVWNDRLRLIKRAAKRFGSTAVVLDTFLSFCLAEDEDRAATLRPLLNQVRFLATDGISVLGTFHDTKAGSPFAGSGSIKGQCDIALALGPTPDLDPAHRKLAFLKNRDAPDLDSKSFTVTMDGRRFIIVEDVPPRASSGAAAGAGSPSAGGSGGTPGQTVQVQFPVKATERHRMAVLAAATEEWQSTQDMEDASGVREGSFRRASKALLKDGLLQKEERDETVNNHPVKRVYYRKSPTARPPDDATATGQEATNGTGNAADA